MNIRLFLFTFSVIFAKIWHDFANIIQNKLKFLTPIVFVTVRDRRALLNCLIEFFWLKFLINFQNSNFFSSKMEQNLLFLVHFVKVCQT